MAKPRLPAQKAEVSGAAVHDPGRFKDRKAPKGRPIGEPYARMTEAEKEIWAECKAEMPWLRASHRLLLRQACVLAARMDSEDGLGVSAIHAFSSILSKLGATPVDETKVTHDDGDTEDPADAFFTRPN